MQTSGLITTEPEMSKSIQVHDDWWALFSGETSKCVDVILRMRDTQRTHSRTEAEQWLQTATLDRLDHEALAIYIMPLGFRSMHDFYANGRARLGEDEFRRIIGLVSNYEMDVTLLLAGYDKDFGWAYFDGARLLVTRRLSASSFTRSTHQAIKQ